MGKVGACSITESPQRHLPISVVQHADASGPLLEFPDTTSRQRPTPAFPQESGKLHVLTLQRQQSREKSIWSFLVGFGRAPLVANLRLHQELKKSDLDWRPFLLNRQQGPPIDIDSSTKRVFTPFLQ